MRLNTKVLYRSIILKYIIIVLINGIVMRLFIGIKLDTKAIKKIDSYMNYLYQTGVRGTYTKTNNIHLTLEFLGEVDKDKVNKLIDIINSIDISKLDYLEIDKTKMLKSIITLNARHDRMRRKQQDQEPAGEMQQSPSPTRQEQ